ATRMRVHPSNIPVRSMAFWTRRRKKKRKHSLQKAELCARRWTSAGSRQRVHFMPAIVPDAGVRRREAPGPSPGAAPHDRSELDVVVGREPCVVGEQLLTANHEHRAGDDLEPREEVCDALHVGDGELAVLRLQPNLHRWRATRTVASPPPR